MEQILDGKLVKINMSISKIKQLSLNPHFFSLLIQSFLSGYEKPCELKLAFMALPILMYEESRQRLGNANKRSRIDTLFQSVQVIENKKISGKTRLAGYVDRYDSLKPYCKEALIILYSKNKIVIDEYKIILIKTLNYRSFDNSISYWLKCAFYLGVVFAKASEQQLSFF